MSNKNKMIAEIHVNKDIKFIEFVSDYIAFRAGFVDFKINEING